FVQRQWRMRQTIAQRFAFDELSRNGVGRSGLQDFINGDDVWMIQRGRRARFLFETMQALVVSGEGLRQQLPSDLTTEPSILRQIDFAHATAADERNDLKWADHTARSQSRLLINEHVGRSFVSGRIEKRPAATVRGHERFDFLANKIISARGFRNKRSALCRRAIQRGLKNLLNLLPSFRSHLLAYALKPMRFRMF